ncbi:hypothetical protein WJX81_005479 [Elliptochloris bilobata]|uniref:Uncharacterized protein n=1 Tax=Elliptochloris bilobata TaxID=381761 RepID=A0AAW1QX19_9CHLO
MVAFSSLEDSPAFDATAAQLEVMAARLAARSKRLLQGALTYRRGIHGMSEGFAALADHLADFCGGPDEESVTVGGANLYKFVGALRELRDAGEMLHVQTDVTLCERLQPWAEGKLAEVQAARRACDERAAAAHEARMLHLGHRDGLHAAMSRRGDASGPAVEAAEAAAGEARAALAALLAGVDARRHCDFLEAVTAGMHAGLLFFERGNEVVAKLRPYIEQALSMAAARRAEARAEAAALQALAEELRRSRQERREADNGTQAGGSGLPAAAGRAAVPGAMQMAGDMAALAAGIAGRMWEAASGSGGAAAPLHQGWLLMADDSVKPGQPRRAWRRRFFVLDAAGMLSYHDSKAGQDQGGAGPQQGLSLLTATVKASAGGEGAALRYAFRVVSPAGTLALQAGSEDEQRAWVAALQGTIVCLLNAAPEARTAPAEARASEDGGAAERLARGHARARSWQSGSGPPLAAGGGAGGSSELAQMQGALFGSSAVTDARMGSPSDALRRAGSEGAGPAAASGQPANARSRSVSGGLTPLELLRGVPGNGACADCGAPDPDWASLNLCVLLCIECSGVHRRLGVHVSKVRSLTLDVRVWDGPVMALMAALGNAAANAVWEEALRRVFAQADSWVWADDSDDDERPTTPTSLRSDSVGGVGGGPARHGERGGLASSLEAEGFAHMKPRASDSLAAKELFIMAKYVEKRFLLRARPLHGRTPQAVLWDAVLAGDARAAMHAAPPRGCSSLRCRAAHAGSPALLEYLLQGGASADAADALARTPLHYAILFDNAEAAKLLLRRGASRQARDALGHTALETAMSLGAIPDVELFMLLSE